MFEELKQILGEPFEITTRNSHRWKIKDYTLSITPCTNGRYNYNLLAPRGYSSGGGWQLTPDRIIEAARGAIRFVYRPMLKLAHELHTEENREAKPLYCKNCDTTRDKVRVYPYEASRLGYHGEISAYVCLACGDF